MKTGPVTAEDVARSVWAVPPLGLAADLTPDEAQNRRLVGHVESGGVSTILWGGNANIYGMTADEVARLIERIPDWVGKDTWAIPSVGPDYGKLMEHAAHLAGTRFPAALLLPYAGPRDAGGTEQAVRDFVQAAGMPAILYLRAAEYLPADRIASLFADGTVVALKYAVETGNFTRDPYLSAICAACPAERIVSGIGELAAIPHLTAFPLAGFTAGAVCIAPRRATAILAALKARDTARAHALGAAIWPLEGLRNAHGPIRVIHDAVTLSGVAGMGPLRPHFSPAPEPVRDRIGTAARRLLELEADVAA